MHFHNLQKTSGPKHNHSCSSAKNTDSSHMMWGRGNMVPMKIWIVHCQDWIRVDPNAQLRRQIIQIKFLY